MNSFAHIILGGSCLGKLFLEQNYDFIFLRNRGRGLSSRLLAVVAIYIISIYV